MGQRRSGTPGQLRRTAARAVAVTAILAAGTGLAVQAAYPAGAASAPQAGSPRMVPQAYPGSEGLIAFVRNGNVYTINPAGTGLAQLTKGGHDSGPRWSPDGAQIAYIHRGNLWVMDANGSHQTRISDSAPKYTDSRPSWSPNGRYLAFVKTGQHHAVGYLTRYDTVRKAFASYTTSTNGKQIDVPALPAPVAWAWAQTGSAGGSFILFQGAGALCESPFDYCLVALGWPHQNQFRHGYASSEYSDTTKSRLVDPDWYPVKPNFATDVMTTVEDCSSSPCSYTGLALTIPSSTPPTATLPGAYQGVYSPTGQHIAYVVNVDGTPTIYTKLLSTIIRSEPVLLTPGTQPDWQPVQS